MRGQVVGIAKHQLPRGVQRTVEAIRVAQYRSLTEDTHIWTQFGCGSLPQSQEWLTVLQI